jgi:hypothetical protein
VVLATTRRDRTLAWIGVIPHWMYFSWLRVNQPLWYQIVVWTSAISCVVALLGLVLGVTQWRRTRPFRLAAAVPYTGWMRWHYLSGAVFGVFALTVGLQRSCSRWSRSNGPTPRGSKWTMRPSPAGPSICRSSPPPTRRPGPPSPTGRAIKEVEFARIQDEPYYVVHLDTPERRLRAERLHQPYYVTGRAERDRLLVAAGTMRVRDQPFSVDSLMVRLKAALPDETVVEQTC